MTQAKLDTIICAECSAATPAIGDCSSCGASPVLNGYALVRRIGHGAVGTTYEARRLADGRRLAIKEILVRRFESAKGMQLFEREAETLQRLEHDGIPRYYDHFVHGHGRAIGFYLVQEFVDGWTLEEERARRSYTDEDLLDLGDAVVQILRYTEGRLVHRDIKPANLMRRASDGALVLIDFGSVRQVARSLTDGSTITGTVGFMAPEQLWGRASFETDVYGLGMTLLSLKLGHTPDRLRDGDGTLSEDLKLGALRELLQHLLAPDTTGRPGSADELAARFAEAREAVARGPLHNALVATKRSTDRSALRLAKSELARRTSGSRDEVALAVERVTTGFAMLLIVGMILAGLLSMVAASGAVGVAVFGLIAALGVLFATVFNHAE